MRLRFRPPVSSRRLDDGFTTDDGFTMIEIMVVLLVMAILVAIAVPTFLAAARSAAGRVAQANLNTALQDSQNVYTTNGQAYQATGAILTTLKKAEPSLTFQTGPSTDHSQVSVYVAADQFGIIEAARSNTEKDCWYTIINAESEKATNGTPYKKLPAAVLATGIFYGEAKAPSSGTAPTCQASAPLNAAAGSVVYQRGNFPAL